jgi:hypothetical protein
MSEVALVAQFCDPSLAANVDLYALRTVRAPVGASGAGCHTV